MEVNTTTLLLLLCNACLAANLLICCLQVSPEVPQHEAADKIPAQVKGLTNLYSSIKLVMGQAGSALNGCQHLCNPQLSCQHMLAGTKPVRG